MIDTVDEDLKSEEEKQLENWLSSAAAKSFLKILEARTKRFQVQAMNEAQQGSSGYTSIANNSLMMARESQAFTDLMQKYMDGKEPLTIVKLS